MTIGEIIITALLAINVLILIPYIKKRIENLATKEDMASITREVEQVKVEFDKQREENKTENQLRLAVVERRFEAHQEAYEIVSDLLQIMSERRGEFLLDDSFVNSFKWWKKNCLYLDHETRRELGHVMEMLEHDFRDGYKISGAQYGGSLQQAMHSLEKAIGLPALAGVTAKRRTNTEIIDEKNI